MQRWPVLQRRRKRLSRRRVRHRCRALPDCVRRTNRSVRCVVSAVPADLSHGREVARGVQVQQRRHQEQAVVEVAEGHGDQPDGTRRSDCPGQPGFRLYSGGWRNRSPHRRSSPLPERGRCSVPQRTSTTIRPARSAESDRILLKSSAQNKAKILIKGQGSDLPPSLPPLTDPITIQLINGSSGVCWAPTSMLLKCAERCRAAQSKDPIKAAGAGQLNMITDHGMARIGRPARPVRSVPCV